MANDSDSINGEQINYFAINDGGAIVEMEANHLFNFNQTLVLSRARPMEGAHSVIVNQATILARQRAMLSDHVVEFDDEVDLYNNAAIAIRMDLAFEDFVEVNRKAFAHWRMHGRLQVREEFRRMDVEEEDRRVRVPPSPAPPPRDMRAIACCAARAFCT